MPDPGVVGATDKPWVKKKDEPVFTYTPPDPNQGAIDFISQVPTGADLVSGDGGASALRDIARRELDWQKSTGLRDIGQAREQGLQAVINNALQRGIYRSGIRIENEAEVNRESDEAVADLEQKIAFALERLKAAESASGGGGGGAGDLADWMRTIWSMINDYGVALPATQRPGVAIPYIGGVNQNYQTPAPNPNPYYYRPRGER